MQVEKAQEFLRSCCRVCLTVENEMVDTVNIVENFNKSIAQLLLECADIQDSEKHFPTIICEDCTTELVLVAKFREKCSMSSAALSELIKQIDQKTQTGAKTNCIVIKQMPKSAPCKPKIDEFNSNSSEIFYVDGYDQDNVEYVVLDSAEFIEETHSIEYTTESIDRIDEHHHQEKEVQHISIEENNEVEDNIVMKAEDSEDSRTSQKTTINFICKLCGAGFAQSNNLQRHLLTHGDDELTTAEQFPCARDDCGETFSMAEQLTEHEKTHEVVIEAPSEPSSTEKISQNPGKRKKAYQKNHKCQYCERAFPTQSLLVTHTRIHTGERPFQCQMCPKAFKTQGALDLHARRHSGLKPYQCEVCNRGFVESSNLKVHMRTHTGEKPHQCTRCGRSFSRVFLLQIHQRTHTGEKPYACDTCNRSFAQQGDLAAHKRIHSGERPHRCKVCNRGFIKSSGLTQHMRRHSRLLSTIDEDATNNSTSPTAARNDRNLTDMDVEVDEQPSDENVLLDTFDSNTEAYVEYLEN